MIHLLAYLLLTTPAYDIALPDTVSWRSLGAAFEESAQTNKPILVYIRAPWCGPCARMERDVFPAVSPALALFTPAALRIDDGAARHRIGGELLSEQAWANRLGAEATPTLVFLAPDGAVITRTSGFVDADSLGLLLAYVGTGAYRHRKFGAYVEHVTGGRIP
ncbi:MAG: thioredoxin fold domain-containing protein [Rhodothermales bacterium]